MPTVVRVGCSGGVRMGWGVSVVVRSVWGIVMERWLRGVEVVTRGDRLGGPVRNIR